MTGHRPVTEKHQAGTATLTRAEDTIALGARLGEELRAGDVVVLSGPLGAGKTVLAKGIAEAMDVEGPVTSPTFVLARVHPARRPGTPAMVHVDVYRLLDRPGAGGPATSEPGAGGPATSEPGAAGPATSQPGAALLGELDSLDLDTDLDDAVVVVEWGEGLAERLSERHLDIRLDRAADSDVRTATWRWSEP
jgi:tRNA threonylcarbamoyladenosine biosynthesis protein TsaE